MATQHKLTQVMLLKICPILRLVCLLEKSKEAASSTLQHKPNWGTAEAGVKSSANYSPPDPHQQLTAKMLAPAMGNVG